MKAWYEVLFENYARTYDREVFTKGTAGECEFIEREAGHDRSVTILDIGCGTGRHAIELTRRGYPVTGIDLSEAQLRRAREKAAAESLSIEFRKHDAREPHFSDAFDMVIMLCEGGFSLMETDEMNFAILENAARALKARGKFIFTTLNGLFPLFHSVKEFLEGEKEEGGASSRENTFDLMTFRDHSVTEFTDDTGNRKILTCSERFYVPPEITWLLKSLNFETIDIYGARLGAFSRDHRLTPDDFEMLVVAVKA